MSSKVGRDRMARRIVGWVLLVGVAGLGILASCDDSVEPPPPPAQTEHVGRFDAAGMSLVVDAPSSSPLRFEVANVVVDTSGNVQASVRIRNAGSTPIVGPQGVAFYGFTPASARTGPTANCHPVDLATPDVPAGACLLSYLGRYGDGMLDPGEVSDAIGWSFAGGTQSFTFLVEPVDRGFAVSGEIAGVVYEDIDGDGVRDPNEPGVASGVSMQFADSISHQSTDASGRFSFHVTEFGNYLVSKPVTCCTNGARTYVVEIRLNGEGVLQGFGSADFGCSRDAPAFPSVTWLDVRIDGAVQCVAAEPCTIPYGTPFAVRFTGAPSCNPLSGVMWQVIPPLGDPPPWQPFGSEDEFLPFARDTVAIASPGDTLWSLQGGTVTVHDSNGEPGVPPLVGRLTFRARVRDREGLVSLISPGGQRHIVLGYDPDTQLQTRVACECPNPPPVCEPLEPRALGWITGVDETVLPIDEWVPFCPGDTIPYRSRVRFFAHGQDDPRDPPLDPVHGQREAGYSYRYTWWTGELANLVMPFSTEYAAQDFPLPGGGMWRGGAIGWETCPYDFTFWAAAVDEHGTRDGTPDSLAFFVSGAPVLDNVDVPPVVVLVPRCASPSCTDPGTPWTFGPDTVLVVGVPIPDPFGLGSNRFTLPFAARGHDHPRDRNTGGRTWYTQAGEGRVRAWKWRLDCTSSGCVELPIPAEEAWRPDVTRDSDPPGVQVFDDSLRVTLSLDTLCTVTSGCQVGNAVTVIGHPLGTYEFALQARDYDIVDVCEEPSDLGPNPSIFQRPAAGRESQIVRHSVKIVQVADVRPVRGKPRGAAITTSRMRR